MCCLQHNSLICLHKSLFIFFFAVEAFFFFKKRKKSHLSMHRRPYLCAERSRVKTRHRGEAWDRHTAEAYENTPLLEMTGANCKVPPLKCVTPCSHCERVRVFFPV